MKSIFGIRNKIIKRPIRSLLIIFFLFFWITGVITGLTAGSCRSEKHEAKNKLKYCDVSIVAGYLFDSFFTERKKRSIIHLERGIALSRLGRDIEARAAFETAISNAGTKPKFWNERLSARIFELNNSHITELWKLVKTNDL